MTRITAAASTISFGSIGFRFIETSSAQECAESQFCSRNSLCHGNLVSLDSVPPPFHGLYCFAHCFGQRESPQLQRGFRALNQGGVCISALTGDHNRADSCLHGAHHEGASWETRGLWFG